MFWRKKKFPRFIRLGDYVLDRFDIASLRFDLKESVTTIYLHDSQEIISVTSSIDFNSITKLVTGNDNFWFILVGEKTRALINLSLLSYINIRGDSIEIFSRINNIGGRHKITVDWTDSSVDSLNSIMRLINHAKAP